MMKIYHALAFCILLLSLSIGSFSQAVAQTWTLLPDRQNNPVYSGISGLTGEISGDYIHIWGTNTDTPPLATITENAELFWPGLTANNANVYSSIICSFSGTVIGNGSGYCMAVTLWQDSTHYISYGLDADKTSGVSHVPSKYTALGGWPNPSFAPSWIPLAGSIVNPTTNHMYKIDYSDGVVRFWLDNILFDTTPYAMDSIFLRLGAYARANGDYVDASFQNVSISGSMVPEPSSILIVFSGIATFVWRKRYGLIEQYLSKDK